MDTRLQSKDEDSKRQERTALSLATTDLEINTIPEEKKAPLEPEPVLEEVIADNNNDHYDACCLRIRPLRPLLYLGPFSVATMEAADIGKSLWTSHTTSPFIIGTGAGAAFISSIGLTGEATKESFNETCTIIKQRRLPEEWPPLSIGNEALSISVATLPALWEPFSKAAQAYFFVDAIPTEYGFADSIYTPGWSWFSGSVGFGVGFTAIFNESAEMYKIIRNYMAGLHAPFQNSFSMIVSPLFGVPLGILNSLQESVQAYIAMKTIFNITGRNGKLLIGLPNLAFSIPKLCFASVSGIEALDEFFGYIGKGKLGLKKTIAFSLSAALSVYLAFLKRPLNQVFYQDVANDFKVFGVRPESIPNDTYELLSWSMFVEESIRGTATLYQPMYQLVDKASNKLSSFFKRVRNYCCGTEETNEQAPLLHEEVTIDNTNKVIVSNHPSTFYGSNGNKKEDFNRTPPIDKERNLELFNNNCY